MNLKNTISPNRIWFTADLHFGHKLMIDKERMNNSRPYSTVEEHDEEILKNINSQVDKHDLFYILGDFGFSPAIELQKIVHQMNGSKFLILGNHDRNADKLNGFEQITQIKMLRLKNVYHADFGLFRYLEIVLCHYPIASWQNKIHDSLHFYGHTHGRFENLGLSLDVGLDAQGYYPVNLHTLLIKLYERNTGNSVFKNLISLNE